MGKVDLEEKRILNDIQSELAEILDIARSVAWGAADILSSYYQQTDEERDLEIKNKKDGPVTQADLAANHYILERLQNELGKEEFGYLSEETFDVKKPNQ